MPKIMFRFWGGAANTHNSVPCRPAKVFLDTMMGVFELHNAKKIMCRFWGGAPNTHASVAHRPAEVFLDTWDGGV